MADLLEAARTKPPSPLLVEWLPKLGLSGGVALDLGCGAGAEAEYLARQGFMVDAIDKNPTAAKYARERCAGLKVDVLEGDFREFEYRPDYYALAVSINALPFVPERDFPPLLEGIKNSIAPGGGVIVAAFGPEHPWSGRDDMNFWTKEEYEALWGGFETIHLEEVKGPWPLMSGEEIFQHRIHLVAKRP